MPAYHHPCLDRCSAPANATVGLLAYTSIQLRIERRNLILLPSTPLAWNDARLGINGSSAVVGDMEKRPLSFSNPVGVLWASKLRYATSSSAGAATDITVRRHIHAYTS
jgi:hypothetical protein